MEIGVHPKGEAIHMDITCPPRDDQTAKNRDSAPPTCPFSSRPGDGKPCANKLCIGKKCVVSRSRSPIEQSLGTVIGNVGD